MRDKVIQELITISDDYETIKMILFGSRARNDNKEMSDYDIAVFSDRLTVVDRVEQIETLKKIDLVFVDAQTSTSLVENIKRDGVILIDKRK